VHINFINLVARSALSALNALNAQADLTDLVDLAAQNCMRADLSTQRSKDRALEQFSSELTCGPS